MEDDEYTQENLAGEYLINIFRNKKPLNPEHIKTTLKTIKIILERYPNHINKVDLDELKINGLRHSFEIFLQIIILCKMKGVSFIRDQKVIVFLLNKIEIFITKECENLNGDSKSENDMNFNLATNELIEEKNEDIEMDYEYIEYVDNDEVISILNFLKNLFKENSGPTLIGLFYKVGLFDLLSVLICKQTAEILNNIFYMRIYDNNNSIMISNAKENSSIVNNQESYMPIHDLQRKMFDMRVVINEKIDIREKKLVPVYAISNEKIYREVIEEIISRNMHLLFDNFHIKDLIHLSNFYFSVCETFNKDSIFEQKKLEHFIGLICSDKTLNEIKASIIEEPTIEKIKLLRYLFTFAKKHSNSNILLSKLILSTETHKVIFKATEKKDKNLRLEIFILYFYVLDSIRAYNEISVDEIDEAYFYKEIGSEKNIKNMIDYVSFDFDKKKEIIQALFMIYQKINQNFFYKISYTIIFQTYISKINQEFYKIYCKGLLDYLGSNRYNFIRIMFPYTIKKKRKNNEFFDQENVEAENINQDISDENFNFDDFEVENLSFIDNDSSKDKNIEFNDRKPLENSNMTFGDIKIEESSDEFFS